MTKISALKIKLRQDTHNANKKSIRLLKCGFLDLFVNFEKLKILSYQLPKNNEYILINKAIAYGVDNVSFFHTSTTGSRITDEISSEQQYIAATTLKNIISEYEVQNDFCLISDIEGAESSIFFEDASSLQNCKTIVADLEDTGSHTCEQQIAKLISVGFSVVERYANVVVMTS